MVLKSKRGGLPWLKPGVFLGSLTPLFILGTGAATGALGANPISTALNQLGFVAMIFLIASLGCTPMKIVFGWKWPLLLRKQLGLWGCFYASLHLLTYAGLDQLFDFPTILGDVTKRPFIIIGFAAFLMLVPLAVTSNARAVKSLGRNWGRLHRLTYIISPFVVVHFFMRMKADISQPVVYGAIVVFLLGVRVIDRVRS